MKHESVGLKRIKLFSLIIVFSSLVAVILAFLLYRPS